MSISSHLVQVEYYVKWKGDGDYDETWETAENLDCPDLIALYQDKRQQDKLNNGKIVISECVDGTKLKKKRNPISIWLKRRRNILNLLP